ncbi:MAG: hypothetical protein P8Y03_24885 [Anaerolineales bacterium]
MAKIKSFLEKRFPNSAGLTLFAGITLLIIFFSIQSINTLWTQQLSGTGKISLANWLQTTPTPSATPFLPVQPGTRLTASITAGGFISESDGEIQFSAQGDAASRIQGEICVSNEGDYPTENLSIENTLQAKREEGPFEDLLANSLDLGTQPVLNPGETFCYPFEIDFTVSQKGISSYRNTTRITITNHVDWTPGSANCPGIDPCPFGPIVVQDFELAVPVPDTPTSPPPGTIPPSPTSAPSPSATPTVSAASETPGPTATSSNAPRPTPTLAPTQETLEPSLTPEEDPPATATASPAPASMTATPAETQTPVNTPTITASPPADTATPTAPPVPTDTPAATSTPVPTGRPTPALILDLAVRVTDDEISAAPGGVVIYSIYFSNYGDVPATGVTLSNMLPDHTAFNADSSFPGWSQVGSTNEYIYYVGDLPAGDSGVVNLAVSVDSPFPAGADAITNTASIFDNGSSGPDANPEDNTASDSTPITNK